MAMLSKMNKQINLWQNGSLHLKSFKIANSALIILEEAIYSTN